MSETALSTPSGDCFGSAPLPSVCCEGEDTEIIIVATSEQSGVAPHSGAPSAAVKLDQHNSVHFNWESEQPSPTLMLEPPIASPPLQSENAEGALLGAVSCDSLPSPASPHLPLLPNSRQLGGHEGLTHDAEVALESTIQERYGATAEWVDDLPSTATAGLTAEATGCGTECKDVSSPTDLLPPKHIQGGSARGGDGRKRRAHEKLEEAERQDAFRRSQRALRKQAKSVNMRDFFSAASSQQPTTDMLHGSASFPANPPALVVSGTDAYPDESVGGADTALPRTSPSTRFGSSAFSPASLLSPSSPSASSAWSPNMVGELTNRFLATVSQRKRQRFEQMVSRELTQSQPLSQTRSATQNPQMHVEYDCADVNSRGYSQRNPNGNASSNKFATPIDELIIGDDDEAANWMPVGPSSPTSVHARRMVIREDAVHDDTALIGTNLREEGMPTSSSVSNFESGELKGTDVQTSEQQNQVVRQLTRKHEIWKLKQRQRLAQEEVEADGRAKALQQQIEATPAATMKPSASKTTPSLVGGSVSASVELLTTPSAAINGRLLPSTLPSLQPSSSENHLDYCLSAHHRAATTAVSASSALKTMLTAEDISTIRRMNSFDNTSTRRVVVFGTASSKEQQ